MQTALARSCPSPNCRRADVTFSAHGVHRNDVPDRSRALERGICRTDLFCYREANGMRTSTLGRCVISLYFRVIRPVSRILTRVRRFMFKMYGVKEDTHIFSEENTTTACLEQGKGDERSAAFEGCAESGVFLFI